MSKVDDARSLLEDRLSELDSERVGIQEAIQRLPLNGNGPARRSRGRRPGPPKGTGKGRKRKGSTRSTDVVKMVKANPGIQTAEVAKRLKIKPNYLYRVVGDLSKEKLIRKDGRKLYAR